MASPECDCSAIVNEAADCIKELGPCALCVPLGNPYAIVACAVIKCGLSIDDIISECSALNEEFDLKCVRECLQEAVDNLPSAERQMIDSL